MRPTAFVLLHPTRVSVVEALCYAKSLIPAVDRECMSAAMELLAADTKNTFALRMSALWSAILECPSWRLRSTLDGIEDIAPMLERMKGCLRSDIEAGKSLLLMATPERVTALRDAGYNIVLLETDKEYMAPQEMLACYPPARDGVCGAWHEHAPESYGMVLNGISIPA